MFSGFVLAVGLVFIIAALVFVARLLSRYRGYAVAHGYRSFGDYLRAAPTSEDETREAVDMTMYGVAFCVLGFAFPPLIIMGAFPLFFGGRKVMYGVLGLGLDNGLDTAETD